MESLFHVIAIMLPHRPALSAPTVILFLKLLQWWEQGTFQKIDPQPSDIWQILRKFVPGPIRAIMFPSKARNGRRVHLTPKLEYSHGMRGGPSSSRTLTSQPSLRKRMLLDYWLWRACAYYSPFVFFCIFPVHKARFTVTSYVCHIGDTVTFNSKRNESITCYTWNRVQHML